MANIPGGVPAPYRRGSLWRKWDLHVHTPCSILNNQYEGATSDERWDKFVADLKNLPPEFKVIGVNDYLFLDGYKKLLQIKNEGGLPNIDLLLPVIELRLDKFAGTSSNWRRVNYHVIFSNAIPAGVIEAQFTATLAPSYTLSPIVQGVEWHQAPTRESLTELGQRIIDAAPSAKRAQYGAPMLEGFNALCVPLKAINDALRHTCFTGKFVTAVGKAEWHSMAWNESSIAEKRTVINGADISFTAADTIDAYDRSTRKLNDEGVRAKLFDCSDAHTNSWHKEEKDRIGNCLTWVKADPTFEGLKLAVREYDDRVYVGDEPPLLSRVRANQTKFIDGVSFAKKAGSLLPEQWMDGAKIELNPGLVAIIGNKGSGKSALSDAVGLLGNSRRYKDFSFLSDSKFRDRATGTKAENFVAELRWVNGQSQGPMNLNMNPVDGAVELVNYIPQNYLEKICTEVGSLEHGDFYRELKSVIFSHVDKAERLGQRDLDSLVKYTTEASQDARISLERELATIVADLVALEAASSPQAHAKLDAAIAQKDRELRTHEGAKPTEVAEPQADEAVRGKAAELAKRIEEIEKKLDECDAALREASAALDAVNKKAAAAARLADKITNFRKTYDGFLAECQVDASVLGLSVQKLVSVSFSTTELEGARKQLLSEQARLRQLADQSHPGSPAAQRAKLDLELKSLHAQLDEPNRKYQAYANAVKEWTHQKARIIGDSQVQGSLEWLKAQKVELGQVPRRIRDKEDLRDKKVREIYAKVAELADSFRAMFHGVVNYVQDHPVASRLSVEFTVNIVPVGLEDDFLALINQKRIGTFCGTDEGRLKLHQRITATKFEDADTALRFARGIHKALSVDERTVPSVETNIADQLTKNVTVEQVYNFIYSLKYLQPSYVLRWDGREIAVLSPGERGTLLLAFYLLIDRNDIPLIIDQPEGNLDNKTVFEVLVDCLKDAKKRRQVVIVTHNPNLAVVCDADQIVYSSIDKQSGCHMTYESGAIENAAMNKHVVDVLEGTKPAFRNRDDKYEAVTSAGGQNA